MAISFIDIKINEIKVKSSHLYLCLLQLPGDGQDVGGVVVVWPGFVLVFVLRWRLVAAVLVACEDYGVSTEIQALPPSVALPSRPTIGEGDGGWQSLPVDGMMPVDVVGGGRGVVGGVATVAMALPLTAVATVIIRRGHASRLSGGWRQAVSTEAAVIQSPAGRQGAVGGGTCAHTAHGDGPLAGGSTPHAAHARSAGPLTQPPTTPAGRRGWGGQGGPQADTLHRKGWRRGSVMQEGKLVMQEMSHGLNSSTNE